MMFYIIFGAIDSSFHPVLFWNLDVYEEFEKFVLRKWN